MDENAKFWTKAIAFGVGGLVLLGIISSLMPFTIVSAGERAVIFRVGKIDRVLSEGMHWVTPWLESVETVDVSVLKEEVEATAASKDLQTVSAKIALNYNVMPDKVDLLWLEFKGEHSTRVIAPAIQEAVKAVTARYTAEELITKRPQVKDDAKNALIERLHKEFIAVDELSIVNFDFSHSFNQAIEAKVTAEQNALAAKNKLEQVKYEKEQRIAEAQGEAEAIRIQAQAIQNQGGEEYVNLKAIEKWNGTLPQYMMSGGSVPFINIK